MVISPAGLAWLAGIECPTSIAVTTAVDSRRSVRISVRSYRVRISMEPAIGEPVGVPGRQPIHAGPRYNPPVLKTDDVVRDHGR